MTRTYECPHCEDWTPVSRNIDGGDLVACLHCGKLSVFVEAQKDGPNGFRDDSYLEIPQDPRLVPVEDRVRMESDD